MQISLTWHSSWIYMKMVRELKTYVLHEKFLNVLKLPFHGDVVSINSMSLV